MTRAPTYDVFVSYRWVEPDQTWVRNELVPALRNAGITVCLDVDDFVPGRDLIVEMTRAGTDSARALAVVTPDYLDGNRMVAFEALMARRSDPGALESRLIPFVLRPTSMPEWLGGIIPIDWLDSKRHGREWAKLLKTLGAKDIQAPPPSSLKGSKKRRTSQTPQVASTVHIISLDALTPRNGDGIGFEIVVENRNSQPVMIETAVISGRTANSVCGSNASKTEMAFYVELDTLVEDGESGVCIDGLVYDSPGGEWGKRAEGRFEFEENTAAGRDRWGYHFAVPLRVGLAPNVESKLRIYFRRRTRERVLFVSDGGSMGKYTSHFLYKEHELRLMVAGVAIATKPLGDEFLIFVANWNDSK